MANNDSDSKDKAKAKGGTTNTTPTPTPTPTSTSTSTLAPTTATFPDWAGLSPDALALVLAALGSTDPRTLLLVAPFVCTQWQTVCRELVAATLDLSWATRGTNAYHANPATDVALYVLLCRFRGVGPAVNLSCCDQWVVDAGVEEIAHCPLLVSLDLSYCKELTNAHLETLAAGCPLLASLNLAFCDGVADVGLEALVAGCPRLAALDLSGCNVTDAGVWALTAGCQQLTSLNLARTACVEREVWCGMVTARASQASFSCV